MYSLSSQNSSFQFILPRNSQHFWSIISSAILFVPVCFYPFYSLSFSEVFQEAAEANTVAQVAVFNWNLKIIFSMSENMLLLIASRYWKLITEKNHISHIIHSSSWFKIRICSGAGGIKDSTSIKQKRPTTGTYLQIIQLSRMTLKIHLVVGEVGASKGLCSSVCPLSTISGGQTYQSSTEYTELLHLLGICQKFLGSSSLVKWQCHIITVELTREKACMMGQEDMTMTKSIKGKWFSLPFIIPPPPPHHHQEIPYCLLKQQLGFS